MTSCITICQMMAKNMQLFKDMFWSGLFQLKPGWLLYWLTLLCLIWVLLCTNYHFWSWLQQCLLVSVFLCSKVILVSARTKTRLHWCTKMHRLWLWSSYYDLQSVDTDAFLFVCLWVWSILTRFLKILHQEDFLFWALSFDILHTRGALILQSHNLIWHLNLRSWFDLIFNLNFFFSALTAVPLLDYCILICKRHWFSAHWFYPLQLSFTYSNSSFKRYVRLYQMWYNHHSFWNVPP